MNGINVFFSYVKVIWNSFIDVKRATQEDENRLAAAKLKLFNLKSIQERRKKDENNEIKLIREEVKKIRDNYRDKNKIKIDRFNELSICEAFYKSITDAVADGYRYVNILLDNELKQYGFVAKKVLSTTLACNALIDAMNSGNPFQTELAAFRECIKSTDFELSLWIDTLKYYSLNGMPRREDINTAAVRLVQTINDVKHYENEVLEAPKRFLHYFKFSPRSLIIHRKGTNGEIDPNYNDLILSNIFKENWGDALAAADEVAKKIELEKYKNNPLDSVPSLNVDVEGNIMPMKRASPAIAYRMFQESAVGLIFNKQFEEFCASSLLNDQYNMAKVLLVD